MAEGATAWGAMLRTAGAFGIAPEGFWRLSLKEWRMLTETSSGAGPMGRAAFEQLMKTWPDGD
ncbi:MAG: phage tail assembly chaperone [Alphaproteobacteria bacterium]|nr:phage tail assembly chaperone [Alphaproteobacteria bacterium]MBU2377788.1 phage tail assembly chaperone [Alphaproteobacteria bacterium]